VVPANIAAEAAIGRVVSDAIKGFAKSSGVNYVHQLRVLLPMIAHMTGAPSLPAKIVSVLDQLRDARNKIAHRGKPEKEITRSAAAEMFTAALFGYHYARLLGEHVNTAKIEGRLPRAH